MAESAKTKYLRSTKRIAESNAIPAEKRDQEHHAWRVHTKQKGDIELPSAPAPKFNPLEPYKRMVGVVKSARKKLK
jgi:hypothetical protein